MEPSAAAVSHPGAVVGNALPGSPARRFVGDGCPARASGASVPSTPPWRSPLRVQRPDVLLPVPGARSARPRGPAPTGPEFPDRGEGERAGTCGPDKGELCSHRSWFRTTSLPTSRGFAWGRPGAGTSG